MTQVQVAELRGILSSDSTSAWVTNLWDKYNQQRQDKVNQWAEVDKYLFATDTSTTANSKLPWTHKTTSPKLTQIRDNLHANYISALFPNDKWLTWVAYSPDAAKKNTATVLQAYMENKTREGNLRDTVSRLLYDYIDYGNVFAMPTFETRYKETAFERTTSFIGPKAVRISPLDIVFNPLASSFENSFKVVRTMTTVGALKKLAMTNPEHKFWEEALERRQFISSNVSQYSTEDWVKASQYQVDGFGSLQEYYQSDSVEILEFYGDYHDAETGELSSNRMITVVDRSYVARDIAIPSYGGEALIRHAGWRFRPDNLWAMGPLDNLVGMQYLIDHYLNMGANALDLKIMPPKKIIGEVEQFNWEPNAEIHIDEQGDVQEMAQQFGDIYTVQQWIENLEVRMEMYAGAPKEAMGIRSPGEKTALEVQILENASSRLFQEKIVQFEIFLEKVLNDMLEVAHRNLDIVDTIKIVDKDIGAQQFRSVTKEDISANGILRPIGARHFAKRANELQNLIGVFNSPIASIIAPHTSGKAMSEFVESVIDLRGYDMFKYNIALSEQQETQILANQIQEDVDMVGMESEEELMQGAVIDEDPSNQEPQ
tara:strand:- start:34371 stop:36167 length:1797 start_codon:yes stop_codon:yes gene_type:complete